MSGGLCAPGVGDFCIISVEENSLHVLMRQISLTLPLVVKFSPIDFCGCLKIYQNQLIKVSLTLIPATGHPSII